DEAAHKIRGCADIDRRNADYSHITSRVLPHAQRANRLHSRNYDHQTDNDRQYRALDEDVCDSHQLSSGFGCGLLPGWTWLFTRTAAPLRNLKTPEDTTSSPGFNPEITAT